MHHKNRLFQLVFLALLFAFPTSLIAQEELTQSYTSDDGMLTMGYPAGWTVSEDNGLIRFSSDQAFMQVTYRNYGEDTTPQDVLEISGSTDYGFSEAQKLVIAGYTAVQAHSTDQLQTVINFCGGNMGLFIGFVNSGQVPTFEPTFMAMMESIRYGEGAPQACGGSFEGLQPITPANAAQVSQLTALGDATVSVENVAFSSDGKLLAAGAADGSVHLWSLVTGKEQATLTGHRDGATSVAFDQGGYNLAVGTGSGQVRLWDVQNAESSGAKQEHSTAVESVAYSPDGFLVASGALDGSLRLWDISRSDEPSTLADSDHPTPVTSVAFSPDGAILAAGGGNTIRLWDVKTQSVQAVLETEVSDIASVSFRPDGALLIYGGSDSAVWAWNLTDDHHILLEGVDPVSALAFSPDGQMIVSAEAGTVRLWDATTGQNLVTLTSPSSLLVNSVAFSADGTLIASGGDTGGVVLWGTTAANASAQAGGTQGGAGESTDGSTSAGETTTAASTCTITASRNVNLRSGPGTNFDRAGTLAGGTSATVDGQATGAGGIVWWRLGENVWVRSDVVNGSGDCERVPIVQP